MKKILNYTLHPITILTDAGAINVDSHGQARCSTSRELIYYLEFQGARVRINKTVFGGVTGLPQERDDTVIVVSAIVANVMRGKGRKDLMVVDSPVREGNKIVGCRALSAETIYGDE